MCSTFSFMYHGNLLQHDSKIENGLEIIKTCYIASACKFCKPLILLNNSDNWESTLIPFQINEK